MSSQPPPLSQTPPLLVKKLSSAAKAPTRGSAFAAGYDIYSARATTIPARGKGMVETDLAIAVPEGTCEFLSCFRMLRFFLRLLHIFFFAFLLLHILSVRFSVTPYFLFNLVHTEKPEKLKPPNLSPWPLLFKFFISSFFPLSSRPENSPQPDSLSHIQ
jgi:hypothetical protein